jgi:hypothetical protein
MTYRPAGSIAFGPPMKERLPSFVYLGLAGVMLAVIVYAQNAPSSSVFFQYIVEGDSQRVLPASVCAIIVLVSAVAAVLRTQMRGVVVHADGIVVRELLTLGWPRVRRLHWSQIDRLSVPAAKRRPTPIDQPPVNAGIIRLDLWDGTRTRLPLVADPIALAVMLEKVALARAIPIEGGTGLIDDLGNPLGDEA